MTKVAMSCNEMGERVRKIAYNSAVKMEATKGREMNTKSRETEAQPMPSLDFDPSV